MDDGQNLCASPNILLGSRAKAKSVKISFFLKRYYMGFKLDKSALSEGDFME
jgi:hypothetical protein